MYAKTQIIFYNSQVVCKHLIDSVAQIFKIPLVLNGLNAKESVCLIF